MAPCGQFGIQFSMPSKSYPIGPRIARQTLTGQAVHLIRADILDGRLALGNRLVETDVAERHQISRTVVREALRILEAEGLVVSDPFRGCSVLEPSETEVEEMFLLRLSLEQVAAATAAYRIKSAQKQMLRDVAKLPPGPTPSYAELLEWDVRIHRTIWQIAGQMKMADQLERVVLPFMRMTFQPEPGFVEAQIANESSADPGGHRLLVEATCSQDPEAARRAMLTHLLTTRTLSGDIQSLIAAVFGVRPPVR